MSAVAQTTPPSAADFAVDEPRCFCPVSTPWDARRRDYVFDDGFAAFEQRTCLSCIASLSRAVTS